MDMMIDKSDCEKINSILKRQMAIYNKLTNANTSYLTQVRVRNNDDLFILGDSLMTLSMDPGPVHFGLSFVRRSGFTKLQNGTIVATNVVVEGEDLIDFDPEKMRNKQKKEKYTVDIINGRILVFVQKWFTKINQCHFILIEKPPPQNYELTCFYSVLIGVLIAYTSGSPALTQLYILDSKFTKAMFGHKVGGGNTANKEWADEEGDHLLRYRGDVTTADRLFRLKRSHDIMDSILQEEAFMRHMGLPVSTNQSDKVQLDSFQLSHTNEDIVTL